ncbi:MAG: L-threonylcarbamoyladenylate synthase [bacterium]|nr:L-threonylcarbamoyladenylate synthase [bacterium]
MKILELNDENYFGVFLETETVLRGGGVVAAPTDTVYGLLTKADDSKAVKKIFAIKDRAEDKPLSVFVKDIPTARKYAYISDSKAEFLEKVWPGKVTMIFHHKGKLAKELTGGKDTIGMRIPDNKLISNILEKLDLPLAQTSANLAGEPPAKNTEDIKNYFSDKKNQPDLVVDGGELRGEPSLVIDFTRDRPVVLRTGILNKSDFDQMMKSMI